MATLHNPNDTVTLNPGVLLTIVRMATTAVDGVVRTVSPSGGVDRWFRRTSTEDGLRVEVDDSGVLVELYLIVDATHSLHETCRRVQEEVSRTIKEFAGMNVSAVNVHIEDVVFGTE
jgi:uncharacterized alkaline shock family protein YloU